MWMCVMGAAVRLWLWFKGFRDRSVIGPAVMLNVVAGAPSVAPFPERRSTQLSYADSLCFWSPTDEHVYQLADLDLGRGRREVVDKCRHCGDLAQPIQTAGRNGRNEWWRPSQRDNRR